MDVVNCGLRRLLDFESLVDEIVEPVNATDLFENPFFMDDGGARRKHCNLFEVRQLFEIFLHSWSWVYISDDPAYQRSLFSGSLLAHSKNIVELVVEMERVFTEEYGKSLLVDCLVEA